MKRAKMRVTLHIPPIHTKNFGDFVTAKLNEPEPSMSYLYIFDLKQNKNINLYIY